MFKMVNPSLPCYNTTCVFLWGLNFLLPLKDSIFHHLSVQCSAVTQSWKTPDGTFLFVVARCILIRRSNIRAACDRAGRPSIHP